MAKLHEILAVESGRKGAFNKILNETISTFKNKPMHFTEYERTLELFEEGASKEEEGGEERISMTTTVPQKLNYLSQFVEDYLDIVFQKEATNQDAVADLVVGKETLIKQAPATFLLGLETKLADIRKVIDAAPTLAPGVEWVPDETHRFKSVVKGKHAEVTNKTRKVIKPFVLYKATDKHPAQVEKLSEDVVVGNYRKWFWSGMISPAEKSELLGRIDLLMEAVKRARMKANEQEVSHEWDAGKRIMDYILGDKVRGAGVGASDGE